MTEMEHVETCYVTNVPVTEQQQREVKKAAEDVYEKIKAGNKLKCLTWGCDGGPSCRRLRRLPTHNVFEGLGVRCFSQMYAHTTNTSERAPSRDDLDSVRMAHLLGQANIHICTHTHIPRHRFSRTYVYMCV